MSVPKCLNADGDHSGRHTVPSAVKLTPTLGTVTPTANPQILLYFGAEYSTTGGENISGRKTEFNQR